MSVLFGIPDAVLLVFRNKAYVAMFLLVAAISFAAYTYLLGSSSMNLALPRPLLGLNLPTLVVATVISLLFSLSVTMSVFTYFKHASCGIKLNTASAAASIIPLTMCCTTVVPGILALFGASTATIIGISGQIQGPLAAYENVLILASVVMLAISIYLTSKQLSKRRGGKT